MVRRDSNARSWAGRLQRWHPEGIPWPASCVYNALSRSKIFREHYRLLAMDVAGRCPEGLILDIGTGPARLPIELCRLSPGVQVVGADISEAMVAQAQENVRKTRLADRISIKHAGAAELPFFDNTFDAVVSSGSLHHFKKPASALDEIYRVLKPGCEALIYDLVRNLPPDIAESLMHKYGAFRVTLLRLHSFEEPFYSPQDMTALALASRFGRGETRFVGALCCLTLAKPAVA